MIALDTNVLVRFLVEDDAKQTERARKLIAKALGKEEILFISDIVVCEAVWVLSVAYHFKRKQIAGVLKKLLVARHTQFASTDHISRALDAYEAGSGDFADYLIREHARAAGCDKVATFDRTLLKDRGFTEP